MHVAHVTSVIFVMGKVLILIMSHFNFNVIFMFDTFLLFSHEV